MRLCLCDTVFPLHEYIPHLSRCSKVKIECALCRDVFVRSDASDHKKRCMKAIIQCAHCNLTSTRAKVRAHECKVERLTDRIKQLENKVRALKRSALDNKVVEVNVNVWPTFRITQRLMGSDWTIFKSKISSGGGGGGGRRPKNLKSLLGAASNENYKDEQDDDDDDDDDDAKAEEEISSSSSNGGGGGGGSSRSRSRSSSSSSRRNNIKTEDSKRPQRLGEYFTVHRMFHARSECTYLPTQWRLENFAIGEHMLMFTSADDRVFVMSSPDLSATQSSSLVILLNRGADNCFYRASRIYRLPDSLTSSSSSSSSVQQSRHRQEGKRQRDENDDRDAEDIPLRKKGKCSRVQSNSGGDNSDEDDANPGRESTKSKIPTKRKDVLQKEEEEETFTDPHKRHTYRAVEDDDDDDDDVTFSDSDEFHISMAADVWFTLEIECSTKDVAYHLSQYINTNMSVRIV